MRCAGRLYFAMKRTHHCAQLTLADLDATASLVGSTTEIGDLVAGRL